MRQCKTKLLTKQQNLCDVHIYSTVYKSMVALMAVQDHFTACFGYVFGFFPCYLGAIIRSILDRFHHFLSSSNMNMR